MGWFSDTDSTEARGALKDVEIKEDVEVESEFSSSSVERWMPDVACGLMSIDDLFVESLSDNDSVALMMGRSSETDKSDVCKVDLSVFSALKLNDCGGVCASIISASFVPDDGGARWMVFSVSLN